MVEVVIPTETKLPASSFPRRRESLCAFAVDVAKARASAIPAFAGMTRSTGITIEFFMA
jgi:hypothetical protein